MFLKRHIPSLQYVAGDMSGEKQGFGQGCHHAATSDGFVQL
jgi:hypothetical protein